VPVSRIAYVDGYGNVKTTICFDENRFRSGTCLLIQINGVAHQAVVSDGTFGVKAGQLAFAPGSSGWKTKHGEQIKWVELFLRGGNAWELFKRPRIDTEVQLKF